MAPSDRSSDKYPAQEAQQRFEAALRGARVAGHKPMESLNKKKPKEKKTGEIEADERLAKTKPEPRKKSDQT
jgi:hypothetical protein